MGDSLLEDLADAIVVVDADGVIVRLNREAERLFGYLRDELLGRHVEVLVPPRLRTRHRARREDYVAAPVRRFMAERGELPVLKKDGTELRAEISLAPTAFSGAKHVICCLRVATPERDETSPNYENQLRAVIADTVPATVVVVALDDGRIAYSSAKTLALIGYEPGSLQGCSLESIIYAHDDYALLIEILHASGAFSGIEIRLRDSEGSVRWALASAKAFDLNGRPAACLTLSDISEIRRLREMAHSDPVTGLPNRTMLQRAFRRAVARANRHHELVGLLFIDVDDFKGVNDSRGHGVGDAVLQSLARRIQSCIRESDMVARFAGDEFVVFLESLHSADEAADVARKILTAAALPASVGEDAPVQVSVTIGIAIYPEHATDIYRLIERADAAMYQAKRQGRNRYTFA